MIRVKIEKPTGSKALALGLLLAALMAASLMVTAKPAHARDFTVANTNNSGAGSLRQAITDANATSGEDRIRFDIPDNPNIPGNEVKTIRPGSQLPDITGPVTIDGYSQPGSKKNTKKAGTNAVLLVELSGTAGRNGLSINADDVVVRGLVINRFGESHIQARGLNNRIEGNFIGPDATGTIDVGGGDDGGVAVTSGSGNVIGGTSPASRNLISGNDRAGVFLGGTEDNRVEGNLIGTSKDGTSPLGNGGGVGIQSSSGNTVGGTAPGAANTIAFSAGDGVALLDSSNPIVSNRILSNSIFSNGALGIDLNTDGPTANDPGDGDSGANNLQNFPVLSSTDSKKGKTAVKGTRNSTPNTTFTLQLFSNPSGEDEGRTFLGEKRVKTDGSGNASFTIKTKKKVGEGENLTATATDSEGNTSEFSAPKAT